MISSFLTAKFFIRRSVITQFTAKIVGYYLKLPKVML